MSLEDYLAFRRRLLTGIGILIALLVLVFIWTIYHAVQKDRQSARMQSKTFVRAIESHVSYTIESVNLSLISFSNAAKALSSEGVLDVALIERLLSRSRDIDSNFWLLFIDSRGRAVSASNEMEVYGKSFLNQDYFKAHMVRGKGVFISGPHVDPMTRRPLFVVSRRVETAAGRFLGVIAAPINARRFAAMFENARYDKDVTIALVHHNGRVIARSPEFEKTFAADMSRNKRINIVRNLTEGSWEANSQLDGQPRYFSYRNLEGLPLIVSVGVANPFLTVSAMRILVVGGLGVLLMIVVLAGSCHFVLKSYRSLEGIVETRTAELNRSQTALRNLAAHQNRVKEKERTRIAREVHDELGGCLTGIKAYISAAAEGGSGNANQGLLSEASKLADVAVDTVRRIIADLRPSVLDQLGIWAALEWYADQFEQRTGIDCKLNLEKVRDLAVDYDTSTMIFRIVQESLTNVARHAHATYVIVQGRLEGGKLVIEIADDGIGIAAEELLGQKAWGILGMHERARHAGAELKISGKPGQGTVVTLLLPEVNDYAG